MRFKIGNRNYDVSGIEYSVIKLNIRSAASSTKYWKYNIVIFIEYTIEYLKKNRIFC